MPTVSVNKADLYKALGRGYVANSIRPWLCASVYEELGIRPRNSTSYASNMVNFTCRFAGNQLTTLYFRY